MNALRRRWPRPWPRHRDIRYQTPAPATQEPTAQGAMPVPDALTIEDFRAALRLWRWQRRMAGQPEGDQPRSGIHPTDSAGAPRAPRRERATLLSRHRSREGG